MPIGLLAAATAFASLLVVGCGSDKASADNSAKAAVATEEQTLKQAQEALQKVRVETAAKQTGILEVNAMLEAEKQAIKTKLQQNPQFDASDECVVMQRTIGGLNLQLADAAKQIEELAINEAFLDYIECELIAAKKLGLKQSAETIAKMSQAIAKVTGQAPAAGNPTAPTSIDDEKKLAEGRQLLEKWRAEWNRQ